MPRDKGIVLCLMRFGKAGDPAELPDRGKCIAPSRNDLVGIALMPHVEDDAVPRRIIHAVERHSQLHGAEVGGQMTSRFGKRLDQIGADLLAEPGQFRCI